MSDRVDLVSRTYDENGRPYALHVVTNPTIDDVLCIEMRLSAYEVQAGAPLNPDRRVGRDVRDFLIKIGVAP